VHQSLDVGDIARLMDLVIEVSARGQCSPSEAINTISRKVLPQSPQLETSGEVLSDICGRIRRLRMRRNDVIGAPLFRDPAWDMLLELFMAHERGEVLTITSLCYAAGVPLSTGTRQFQRLEDHGLTSREDYREDTRCSIARPTTKAVTSIASLVAMMLDERIIGAAPTRVGNCDPKNPIVAPERACEF
jgi:DNA-binding MarR family transcriptional regulator